MQQFKNYTEFMLVSPNDILGIDLNVFKKIMIDRLGKDKFFQAYQCNKLIKSPASSCNNSDWFKKSKIIGVNPRITGSFINIVKYALTFPENAIHIMPFFESGHEGSLYVQNSWRISDEFFDNELKKDGFDTVEKQLKVTINLLHALGKAVGFDVLTHVDNFSEIVFLNPKYFEWAKLNKNKTSQLFPPEVDYNKIYLEVEKKIVEFVKNKNPEINFDADNLFNNTDEHLRHKIIFGENAQKWKNIRLELMKYIRSFGYETLPVVEHAPIRPIVFEKIANKNNTNWAQFKVENKAYDAIILGCVTPYKWYKIDDMGYPQTTKYETEVWKYFIDKYKQIQEEFNFDFIRADMAHNQISHSSKTIRKNKKKEFWRELKKAIQKDTPYFATLAEAFYNTYYIDGYSDMMNKNFDVVLGNLNYRLLNENYINHIKDFLEIYVKHFSFAPCVCTFTNDSDKKEHNICYQSPLGNEIRMFCAFFLELPSYMGMGYELRNSLPKKGEEYSFNYIKNQKKPYKWGNNEEFLSTIFEMREVFLKIKKEIKNPKIKLCDTDSISLAWLYLDENNDAKYLFCFNLDTEKEKVCITLNKELMTSKVLKGFYSNIYEDIVELNLKVTKSSKINLNNLPIGACLILSFV